MTNHASSTFEVTRWDEKPYVEADGGLRLTRASVAKVLHGDIEGESTIEYLMTHPGNGSANFVGQERVVGRIGDRSGSFVLQHTGTDDGHTARSTWFVVPGSGTGELRGLRGQGAGTASRNEPQYRFTLDYDFG